MSIVIYTDGACRGNPGPGGWAWAIDRETFGSGHDPQTTNQRMELTAAAKAVEAFGGPIEIRSDSTYVVKCFQDEWWRGWIKRGWRNSQKQPVANRDLWEPFINAVIARGDVTFTWVKGHSTNVGNNLADELAVEASHNPDIGDPGSQEGTELYRGGAGVGFAKRGVGGVDAPDLDLRLFDD